MAKARRFRPQSMVLTIAVTASTLTAAGGVASASGPDGTDDTSSYSASRGIPRGRTAYLMKHNKPRPLARIYAKSRYHFNRHRVKLDNFSAKHRKPVFVFKLRKRASWQSGKRCWLNRRPGSDRWCSVKRYKGHKIRPNKLIYWRLCRGLYAPRKKNQRIRWHRSTHCTNPQKFNQ